MRCLDGITDSMGKLNEFEQAPRDGKGWGSLVCYSPWSCKESDTTEQQKNKMGDQLSVISFIFSRLPFNLLSF